VTPEELARIKEYADRLTAANGDIGRLTIEERHGLARLLIKWLAQTEQSLWPW